MGYYTDFSIQLVGEHIGEVKADEVMAELEKISEYGFYREGVQEIKSSDSCKWYEHEEHLKALAITYPDIGFEVKGIGEEQPDMWAKYFRGDNFHGDQAVMSFPKPPDWFE